MMFRLPADRLRREIATIATCARLNGEFRALRYGSATTGNVSAHCGCANIAVPDRGDWIVYDHCASVTRLYAVYERFVGEVVTAWLDVVPTLFNGYSDLPESLRKHHRLGVAHLLPKAGQGRYKHLSITQVIEGLFRGAKLQQDHHFLYEQFAVTERNLRLDALSDLLARVGIDDLKGWFVRHRELQLFMATVYGGQETVDGKLNDLVSYRNEAAHGENIGQVLGLAEFLSLTEFIEAICASLAECVFHRVYRCQIANSPAAVIGKVTEVLPRPQAIIALLENCTIEKDQELIAFSRDSCKRVQILSLQLNGVDASKLDVIAPTEVGIRFSYMPSIGTNLVASQRRNDIFMALDI
jgi:hypothetical protein